MLEQDEKQQTAEDESEKQKKSKKWKKWLILLLLLLFGILASYFFFLKDKDSEQKIDSEASPMISEPNEGYDGSGDIEGCLNSSTEENEQTKVGTGNINGQPTDSESIDDIDISTMTFERNEGYDGSEDIEGGLNSSKEENEQTKVGTGNINGQPTDSEAIGDIDDFPNILRNGIVEILFSFDSYNINKKNKKLLQKFANHYLKNNKQATIIIEGYTCDIGKKKYNDILSYRRTNKVYNLLLKYGIPKKNIELKWYGERKCYKLGYEKKKGYRRVNVSVI